MAETSSSGEDSSQRVAQWGIWNHTDERFSYQRELNHSVHSAIVYTIYAKRVSRVEKKVTHRVSDTGRAEGDRFPLGTCSDLDTRRGLPCPSAGVILVTVLVLCIALCPSRTRMLKS